MKKKVIAGIQNFETIIKGNYLYIDKTDFIRNWWEFGSEVTLITRPRRFGKTLTMNMLNCFFSVNYANRADLFQNLKIWQYEEYRKLQGTYPVIFLTFASANSGDFDTDKEVIFSSLRDLYDDNIFLLDSGILSENETVQFKSVTEGMSNGVAVKSVHYLSKYLSRYYKKPVIILLDEYDAPMIEAWTYDYWEEMTKIMRPFFNATFKTNPYLGRGIMTGITRVTKESMFSGLNNLKVVSVTSSEYADVFGFTEEEVFAVMDERGKTDADKKEVKRYYDGFTFGDKKEIYNPWSIIHYLESGKLLPYWANNSGNVMLEKIIHQSGIDFKCDLERLISNESITKPIDENINFKNLYTNPNAAWSLLLSAGYLKAVEQKGDVYTLSLTNFEVRTDFEAVITNWISQGRTAYTEFIQALLDGNREEMTATLSFFLSEVTGFFDTGGRVPEKFYHGFCLGMVTQLHKDYIIYSNRKSGRGRADVWLYRKDRTGNGIILEFKALDVNAGEEKLEDTVKAALKQIEDKKYDVELKRQGFTDDRIRKYGIAFSGQDVLVGDK